MLIIFSIISINTIVVCADNFVNCSAEGLPELPSSAKFYPYFTEQLVTNILLRQKEITSAYVVFGGGAPLFQFLTQAGSTSNLQELTLYSTIDNLLVTFMPLNIISSIRTYNFIRVQFQIIFLMDTTFGGSFLKNTMVYFHKGASIVNPTALTLYVNGVPYPLTETIKTKNIQFYYRSYFNYTIYMNECKNYTYQFTNRGPKIFGLDYPENIFYFDNFEISFYYDKNSDYSKTIIFTSANDPFIIFNTNIVFNIVYVPEEREIVEEHEITILFTKEMGSQFQTGVCFHFYIKSSNLKLKIIRETNNAKVAYVTYNIDSSIQSSYPINQNVMLYNNESLRPYQCSSTLYYCRKISCQKEFDEIAGDFNQIPLLQIIIDGYLSLNLSKINLTNELALHVTTDISNPGLCHFDLKDEPSSSFGINLMNCNLSLPENKIINILEDIATVGESVVFNHENINYQRVSCHMNSIQDCKNQKKKVAVITLLLYSNNMIMTIYEKKIEFFDVINNLIFNSFTYGEDEEVNSEDFIFVLDLAYVMGDGMLLMRRDPSASTVPNFSFRYSNRTLGMYKFTFTFDDSFQIPPASFSSTSKKVFFNVEFFQNELGVFFVKNPPSWIKYEMRIVNDPQEIYDMSPLSKRKFLFCTPDTLCSGLTLANDEIGGIVYRPDVKDTEAYLNKQVTARIGNSLDIVDYVIVIYGMVINSVHDPYTYDPFDSSLLGMINDTIHFTCEYVPRPVNVDIHTSSENHAKTWIVDGITLNSDKHWNIPNIKMINGGRFFSSIGVNATNIEVDYINMDVVSNMNYTNLTIRLGLISTDSTIISISENSILINLLYNISNIPKNANVTIIITQMLITDNTFNIILLPTPNGNIRNLRFLINEENTKKIIFDFYPNSGWETITNSPYFEIIAKNYSNAEIKHLVHPIHMVYRGFINQNIGNDKNYYIYEVFPMNRSYIGLCLSNIDDTICSNMASHYISNKDSIYKKIESNDELVGVFQSFTKDSYIQNLSLLIQPNTKISLNISSFDFIPKNIRINGKHATEINFFVSVKISSESPLFNSFSVHDCFVNLIPNELNTISNENFSLRINTLSIDKSEINATIEVNEFYSSIFDFPKVKGFINNAYLNYTSAKVLSPHADDINQQNAKKITASQQTKYINAGEVDEPKVLPNIDIIISKSDIKFDSSEVFFSPSIKINNIVYDLLFSQSSTITFKFDSGNISSTNTKENKNSKNFSNINKKYVFHILFVEKADGYVDTRTIKIKFDNSWIDYDNFFGNDTTNDNVDEEKISINMSPKENHIIYYTIQEIPKNLNLYVKKGVAISVFSATPLPSRLDSKGKPYQRVSVLTTVCIMLVIVIVSGTIIMVIMKSKMKLILFYNKVLETNNIDNATNSNS